MKRKYKKNQKRQSWTLAKIINLDFVGFVKKRRLAFFKLRNYNFLPNVQ